MHTRMLLLQTICVFFSLISFIPSLKCNTLQPVNRKKKHLRLTHLFNVNI